MRPPMAGRYAVGMPRSRLPGSAYQPLVAYLATQPRAAACTLTFLQIETALGRPLPVQAHAPDWWRNPTRSVAPALAAAGWRAETTQLWRDRVTFVRVRGESNRTDSTA